MPLTDTEVRKSKPSDKPYRLSDANSLFLRITPAGGKLWRWAYDFEGREKLMSLGKYPIVTLAEARERRDQARKLLANGIDPMAKRKEQKTLERAQTRADSGRLLLSGWNTGRKAKARATSNTRSDEWRRTSCPSWERVLWRRSKRQNWWP